MKGRQRGRNGGGGKPRPPGRNPNFDGNNNRPRGNAQQLMEKYLALARDATSAGDRVLAENYFQHADHYYRVLNARFEQQNGGRRFDGQGGHDRQHGDRHGQERSYEGDQPQNQNMPSTYQTAQTIPIQQHVPPAETETRQPSNGEAEIALPPGILGNAPLEATPDSQDAEGEAEADAPTPSRGRQGGRRRRSRSDRAVAAAGQGE